MSDRLKKDLRNLSLEKIQTTLKELEEKTFRARQIYYWIWHQGVKEFHQMSNLPKDLQAKLKERFYIRSVELKEVQYSSDGTLKNGLKLYDGKNIESVLIPSLKRSTGCISSQVGCSLDCAFCATSQLPRMRNLEVGEIYDQVQILDSQSRKNFKKSLNNIVFMGMGEPLLNYKNVMKAIERIITSRNLQISARRITLSTSGIPKMIRRLADDEPRFKLALSLHAVREEIRNSIMPFSKNFPLTELLDSLKYWYSKTKDRITIEYIIWEGINDQQEDIRALVKFCKAVPSKVNLIEYNPIGKSQFRQVNEKKLQEYLHTLEKNGIVGKIRHSRGKDIDAACGQLANKNSLIPSGSNEVFIS
ncbi:23S rRNA (adenine(2503)-C(2))-methyltransferase RlmN [Bacteroidetes bacterium endosymbiont of Geopemphigus sp.]|uniref:23S rRNA (adenine(2503)-C(2))-methyltransferase RlmN n=1 Tax=Bacteroidetes bacterium endosymbiont of Geopemphigus sp. TaxID=2047937 RepID=UPI000CD10019|nr:23S rRNA (adenine(2503)-C(2))-methyltransferase RlmN [Bacteroidetes bacterium endosymbiont of Geopemphigus sp.]